MRARTVQHDWQLGPFLTYILLLCLQLIQILFIHYQRVALTVTTTIHTRFASIKYLNLFSYTNVFTNKLCPTPKATYSVLQFFIIFSCFQLNPRTVKHIFIRFV